MFQITFLGTSASAPSARRGLPAHLVQYGPYRFLVDCGEGTQRQILRSGLGFRRLQRVFLTHGHLDHILGLGGLISTFMRWESVPFLEIYAGPWALDRVRDLVLRVVLRDAQPPMELRFREIHPGLIWETESFWVTAHPVWHKGTETFAFVFEEKPRRPFLVEKAEALGIPPGPWRRRLVEGQTVTLPDGRVVHPDEVLGPPRPGIKYVHIGDIGRIDDQVVAWCQGADLLIIEATYLEAEADVARSFGHITARQAATLAREAGVKHLVLTHLSRRYSDHQVLREAQQVFPQVWVARDFDLVEVRRDGARFHRPSKPPPC